MNAMGLYDGFLRRLLFRMDPERAHSLALWFVSHGLVRTKTFSQPSQEQELFGVKFPNPLGLAAGFDKNALALSHWRRLGFGFVEIGTVTYHPQPGNPKPRVFRLPKDRALINRLGFNNDGAEVVAARIGSGKPNIPVGINLGKSKITPLEGAAEDYAASYRLLHTLGDYFVINVSSPNTPGLRDLQEKDRLRDIVSSMREIDESRPLFVKISPDLASEGLDDVAAVAHELKLTGIVATNTTLCREDLSTKIEEYGGLSGAPLLKRSTEVLRRLYAACDRSMILIGVGGIFTGEDLLDKVRCGAHLCQGYTGLVFRGPTFAARVLEEFGDLQSQGSPILRDLRGSTKHPTPDAQHP